jgi:hypothetical protein
VGAQQVQDLAGAGAGVGVVGEHALGALDDGAFRERVGAVAGDANGAATKSAPTFPCREGQHR